MSCIKKNFIITLLCFPISKYMYCQSTTWDENYTYTVFYDDFSNNQICFADNISDSQQVCFCIRYV